MKEQARRLDPSQSLFGLPSGVFISGINRLSMAAVFKCPRCDSENTKFCYYNNYNLSQPRHFCKSCRRYWTRGGVLRNVPVGGGSRKSLSSSKRTSKKSVADKDRRVSQAPPIYANSPLPQQEKVPTAINGAASTLAVNTLEVMDFGFTNLPSIAAVQENVAEERTAAGRVVGFAGETPDGSSGGIVSFDWSTSPLGPSMDGNTVFDLAEGIEPAGLWNYDSTLHLP